VRGESEDGHFKLRQGGADLADFYLSLRFLPAGQGLKAAIKYDHSMEKKMATPTDLLCSGFPNEFGIFLNYCRTLRFDDKPDYLYLKKLFRDLFVREGFQYDYVSDWSVQRQPDNAAGKAPVRSRKEGDEPTDRQYVYCWTIKYIISLSSFTFYRLRSSTRKDCPVALHKPL